MMGLTVNYIHYIGGNMDSLLKRITDKAKERGYGFRLDAYEMWQYGCEDFISDYHTSYDKLVEDLQAIDCEGTIHLAKLEGYVPLQDRLNEQGLESIDDIDDDIAFDLLSGDYFIRWINWGGNRGADCLNDGSSTLWDVLGINDMVEEYEKELETFERF